MNKDTKKTVIKKTYEKPRLRIVNISNGIQTLGIGCKLSDAVGDPNVRLPIGCGLSNGCVTPGS